jgi:electron-transferring-flavoprotein dehydrogenase
LPRKRIDVEEDAAEPKTITAAEEFVPDGQQSLSKVDAVFLSGNATRDDIPSHLIAESEVPLEVQEMYEHMCPAGVYEAGEDGLVTNAPNCIDCKATDVLGPRWTPREGGSGPAYKRM